MNNYYVTHEGYQKLILEIEQQDSLHAEAEKAMGQSAQRDNDLRENPEYMELRVKAMYGATSQRRELLMQFQSAVIIEETPEYINWDEKTIIRKCRVTLNSNGNLKTYTILGANEGDFKNGVLSCETPLVLALLGKKVGDEIIFNNNRISVLSVERISYEKHEELIHKV